MPIEGLSGKRMIPRLGKIHMGFKNERGLPVRTDYFVFPKDHPQYKQLVETFGEKPKELRILIPTEDEEKWCSQYYRCYSQSRGLICKGDGIAAMRAVGKGTDQMAWKDAEAVEMKEIQCLGRECEYYLRKKCGEVMNMQFLLPEIPGLGIWQIDTGSVNSIININSASELIKQVFKRISMIPLLLTIEPKEVNNPDTKKKMTVYVMNLRTNSKLMDVAQLARSTQEIYQLPVGDNEAPDFAPDYEPVTPDTRPIQEQIDDLWPEAKSTEEKKEKPVIKANPVRPAEPEAKQQVSEPIEEVKKPIPDTIKTAGDLINYANRTMRLSLETINAKLGTANPNALTMPLPEAWEKLNS